MRQLNDTYISLDKKTGGIVGLLKSVRRSLDTVLFHCDKLEQVTKDEGYSSKGFYANSYMLESYILNCGVDVDSLLAAITEMWLTDAVTIGILGHNLYQFDRKDGAGGTKIETRIAFCWFLNGENIGKFNHMTSEVNWGEVLECSDVKNKVNLFWGSLEIVMIAVSHCSKSKLHKRYLKSPAEYNKKAWTDFRNYSDKMVQHAKFDYIQGRLSHCQSPRNQWKIINGLILMRKMKDKSYLHLLNDKSLELGEQLSHVVKIFQETWSSSVDPYSLLILSAARYIWKPFTITELQSTMKGLAGRTSEGILLNILNTSVEFYGPSLYEAGMGGSNLQGEGC
ncbi:hypothetical protein CHUAL_009580 [Chamberlinius hualienensis]